ncbi:LicD family protein [Weissella confusa]|uniref:LicD family protein n=1 Tax=Weissella confusa TaxID=1583 RepID=UPI002A75FED7|nr:LicD family protein [Weissella confusa]MDY2513076.1 LicD family protein [Weissella confusa]
MNNYKKSETLEYIQEVDYGLMEVAKKIFQNHNLSYFLIAGSFLGAVRHKGFIPWDDDVDFGMPRQDYEIFLNHMHEWLPDGFTAENFGVNSDYKYYITRVYDENAPILELRGEGEGTKTNVSIDIFPFDGTPNNKVHRWFFMKEIMFLRMLASFANRSNIDDKRQRNILEQVLITIANVIRIDRFVRAATFYKIIDRKLKKYKYDDSEYVGSLMGAYREKEIVKKDWIDPLETYQFEQDFFLGPRNYDAYLTHMYGDYRQIPSDDKIIEKQHFSRILELKDKEADR